MKIKYNTVSESPLRLEFIVYTEYPIIGYFISIIEEQDKSYRLTIKNSNNDIALEEIYRFNIEEVKEEVEKFQLSLIKKNIEKIDNITIDQIKESFEKSQLFKKLIIENQEVHSHSICYKLLSKEDYETNVLEVFIKKDYSKIYYGIKYSSHLNMKYYYDSNSKNDINSITLYKTLDPEKVILKYFENLELEKI